MSISQRQKILNTVYLAVDDVNEMQPEGEKLQKKPDTIIVGEDGLLDSLGVISFLAAVEDRLEQQMDLEIVLTDRIAQDDAAMLQSVEALVTFITDKSRSS